MKKTADKIFKTIACSIAAVLVFAAGTVRMYAMEDGAYTAGRTTSYTNPETGQTADGGTNIALGQSMCESIVEEQALVEQSDGKTYVTLGFGLMSNVGDVKVKVQTEAGGDYKDVELTQTGSCSRDGDTCNHYRFEVVSPDLYISPILYVTPMGREVQFFVKLDMASAQAGTGNFKSEMIKPAGETKAQPETEESAKTEENSKSEEKTEETKDTQETKDGKEDKADGQKEEAEQDEDKKGGVSTTAVAVGVALVVGIAGAAFVLVRRKRG